MSDGGMEALVIYPDLVKKCFRIRQNIEYVFGRLDCTYLEVLGKISLGNMKPKWDVHFLHHKW